jgi:predicted RNase H-like nuclease
VDRQSKPSMRQHPGVAWWAAGVDGCRGGWLVVLARYSPDAGGPLQTYVHLCPSFMAVLAIQPEPRAIALDMPVGLLDGATPGGRECDRAARALLGRPRSSSVFSPPARPALANTGYRNAIDRNGGGMTKQAYNILPRIREVDAVMTPALQARVFETHPELVFAQLGGAPMRHPKRTAAGARERLACLRKIWGEALPPVQAVRKELGRGRVALDDVLDACALAHAAACIVRGRARCLPGMVQRDAQGLRMEIWF